MFLKRPGKICTMKEMLKEKKKKVERRNTEQNRSDPLQMEYYLFKGQATFCSVFVLESACVLQNVLVPFYSQKLHQMGLLPNKERRNR